MRLLSACVLAGLMVAACSTNRNRQVDVGPIDELVLLSAPAAVDVEPAPGPDGVAVRLYATSQAKSKSLAISNGKVEILMFDGTIKEETPSTVQPLKVWSNSASELRPFATRTTIGVSYPLTLLWGNARPGER